MMRHKTLCATGSYKVYLLVFKSEAKSDQNHIPLTGVGLLIIGMDWIISGHFSLSAPSLLSVTIQRRESYGSSGGVGGVWGGG